jgi:predicted DNA-binding transcriptional regulator AlpA
MVIDFQKIAEDVSYIKQETSALRAFLSQQTTSPQEDDKPLNVTQAADFLGISQQTVYQRIAQIPHRKRFGKLFFFRRELLEYINAGEEQSA